MNKAVSGHKKLRFVLTAVGLALSGIIFGVIGGIAAGRGLGDGSLADLGLAIIGLLLGYIVGILVGLFFIRFALKRPGSIVLGTMAAVVWAGLSVAAAIPFNLSDNVVSIFIVVLLLCVPVAALLGFSFKR